MSGRQCFESGHGRAGREYQIKPLHELSQVRAQQSPALVQLVQGVCVQCLANGCLRRKVGVGQGLLLFTQSAPHLVSPGKPQTGGDI